MSVDSTNQLVIPPFGFITGTPPVIPDFYWNVYSDEERYKFLAVNLQKLADYANTLNDEVAKLATTSPEDVTQIKEQIEALQTTVASYDDAVKQMTANNTAAKEAADAAQTKATEALANSENAVSTASAANTAATTATETASEAKTTAEAASKTAATASTTATAAQSAAATASTTANNASTKADQAATDAASAKQSASDAATSAAAAAKDASDAKTAASAATETASDAKTAATTATTTANDAKTAATTASTTADNALNTANTATETANGASDIATEAQKLASSASTAAETATSTATTATETANAAKTAADTATETANAAKTAADTATTTASEAKSSAETAATSASNAQTAAETASSEATSIAKSVSKTFDTVADMQAGNNFTVGEVVRTLGFYTANDGGGASYEIVEKGTKSTNTYNLFEVTANSEIAAQFMPGPVVSDLQLGCTPTIHEAARCAAVADYGRPYIIQAKYTTKNFSATGLSTYRSGSVVLASPLTSGGQGPVASHVLTSQVSAPYPYGTSVQEHPYFSLNTTAHPYNLSAACGMPSSANQSVYYILVMGSTPTVHDVDGRVIGVSLNISDAVLTTEFDGVVKEGMLANGVFLYSSQCNGTGASGSPVEYAAFADSSVLNYITIDNAADFYYGFIKGQDIGWTHADTAVDLNSAYIPILPNCNLLGHLADAYDILTAGYYEVHSFWVNGTHRVEFTDGTGVKYILVFDGTSITARYSVTPAIVEAPSDNTSS